MGRIFAGLLFIFFDFTIHTDLASFDILPDFIGYILILNGLNQMQKQSIMFKRAIPPCSFMIAYSTVIFALDFFRVFAYKPTISFLLGIVSTGFHLWILYLIISGLAEIEVQNGADLNTESLLSNWKIILCFNIACVIFFWLPVMNILLYIVIIIFTIVFMISFYHVKEMYQSLNLEE